jgi:uncharacterized protein
VNDFARILTNSQVNTLERALQTFNDSTSNQIVVVLVNNLGGADKAQYAYELGEKWGVGQQRFDNGVVVLIKPKTERERGEAFIATGYGMEGVLPDVICRRIVDEQMIPRFRESDYYGGIVAALEVIVPLAKGEYSEKLNRRGGVLGGIAVSFVMILIIFLTAVLAKRKGPKNFNNRGRGGRGAGDFWTAMILGNMLGNGSRSSGGSWGGFSGGTGGFGGGSFGGGGAGGSW